MNLNHNSQKYLVYLEDELNNLPEDVVSAPTFSSFRRRLKPFLFQQSYPDIVI